MYLPLKAVVTSNTIAQNGNITFHIEDATGAIVVVETTQKFPTTMPKIELREYLESCVKQAEADNAPDDDVSTATTDNRAVAKSLKTLLGHTGTMLRALFILIMKEFNRRRKFDADIIAAFQNNTTVANIRTAVIAVGAPPQLDIDDIKDAYDAEIDGGNAD